MCRGAEVSIGCGELICPDFRLREPVFAKARQEDRTEWRTLVDENRTALRGVDGCTVAGRISYVLSMFMLLSSFQHVRMYTAILVLNPG